MTEPQAMMFMNASVCLKSFSWSSLIMVYNVIGCLSNYLYINISIFGSNEYSLNKSSLSDSVDLTFPVDWVPFFHYENTPMQYTEIFFIYKN